VYAVGCTGIQSCRIIILLRKDSGKVSLIVNHGEYQTPRITRFGKDGFGMVGLDHKLVKTGLPLDDAPFLKSRPKSIQ